VYKGLYSRRTIDSTSKENMKNNKKLFIIILAVILVGIMAYKFIYEERYPSRTEAEMMTRARLDELVLEAEVVHEEIDEHCGIQANKFNIDNKEVCGFNGAKYWLTDDPVVVKAFTDHMSKHYWPAACVTSEIKNNSQKEHCLRIHEILKPNQQTGDANDHLAWQQDEKVLLQARVLSNSSVGKSSPALEQELVNKYLKPDKPNLYLIGVETGVIYSIRSL